MRHHSSKVPVDQKWFLHAGNLGLERLAESLFGSKYHKAIDRTDIGYWRAFYISTFEVLLVSVGPSIGSVDPTHRSAIDEQLRRTLESLKAARAKDEVHGILILGLFRLVFLLLGRLPYPARGKRRELATFRTLTYSQTEEQLSWLLQGHVQQNAATLGFDDSFDADRAYSKWCSKSRRHINDRSSYVNWVRECLPETYSLYR